MAWAFRAQTMAARWQEWGSVAVPASPGILECHVPFFLWL